MYNRKKDGQTPPSSQKLGTKIFPIIPFRYQFVINNNNAVDDGQGAFTEVNFNLSQELYQVVDIYRWESEVLGNGPVVIPAVSAEQEIVAALLEQVPVVAVPAVNPPTLIDALDTSINLLLNAQYRGDTTVVATHSSKFAMPGNAGSTGGSITKVSDLKQVDFIQPWTVGANVAGYGVYDQTNATENVPYGDVTFKGTIWGRIRYASKDEWYAVNYRRFR